MAGTADSPTIMVKASLFNQDKEIINNENFVVDDGFTYGLILSKKNI